MATTRQAAIAGRRRARAMMVAVVMLTPALAGATDQPHDTTRLTQGCENCHTGHNAIGGGLTKQSTKVGVCFQCHTTGGTATAQFVPADQANLAARTGKSHAWSTAVTGNALAEANAPALSTMLIRLDGTAPNQTLSCSVCHDQNHQSNASFDPRQPAYSTGQGWGRHFMRIANDSNQLCVQCHQARATTPETNVRAWNNGNYLSHPFNVAMSTAKPRNIPPMDVGGTVPQVEGAGWATSVSIPVAGTTQITDTSKSWGATDALKNMKLRFTSGQNVNTVVTITGSGSNSVKFATPAKAVAAGDRYEIDADGNVTNNIVLYDPAAGSACYTKGNVVCMSCHAVHFSDSDSTTYDAPGLAGAGDGALLRRTNKPTGTTAQIAQTIEACTGCHKEKMHNGKSVPSPRYGTAWGASWTCQTCHQPHRAKNVLLVKSPVDPTGFNKAVDFRSLTGFGTYGYAWGTTGAAGQGPCEVCHTQTQDPNTGKARFRNTGNLDNGTGSAGHHVSPTQDCADCHNHTAGFKVTCYGCHGDGGRTVISYWTLAAQKDRVMAAPPSDGAGSAGSPKIGAHVAHVNRDASTPYRALSRPQYCDQCHETYLPTTYAANGTAPDTAHGNNRDDILFSRSTATGLATRFNAITNTSWVQDTTGTTGGTCSNVYCHGNFTPYGNAVNQPIWNPIPAPAQNGLCGTCHGAPPPTSSTSHHPPNPICGQCHNIGGATGYSGSSSATWQTDLSYHVDGTQQKPLTSGASGCTACHGDANRVQATGGLGTLDPNYKAASPYDAHGNVSTSARGVGMHGSHTNPPGTNPTQLHNPLGCADCHPVPASGDIAHADGSPVVTFGALAKTGGVSPAWNGTTCSSVYCHGNFTKYGLNASPTWAGTSPNASGACGTCHLVPPAVTGGVNHPQNNACGNCHGGYTATSVNLTLHINGSKDAPPNSCTACHGDTSRVATSGITTDANFKAAPPWDSHGNTFTSGIVGSSNGVGAHLSHVDPPASRPPMRNGVACSECHGTSPAAGDMSHANGSVAFAFGALAKTGGITTATWNGSTCASTYCHGNIARQAKSTLPLPSWTSPIATLCGSCHDTPPAIAQKHPQNNACSQCHNLNGAVYSGNSSATWTVDKGHHVDGVRDAPALGCTACHGDAARVSAGGSGTLDTNYKSAPPWDSHGNTLTSGRVGSQRGVGAHLLHVNPPATNPAQLKAPLPCSDCHGTVPTGTDTNHVDGTIVLSFSALASTGGLSPAFNGTTCSNVYCHRLDGAHGGSNNAPNWTGSGQATCGSCHGIPPPNGSHSTVDATTNCSGCHPGYNCTSGSIATCAVDLTKHLNGALDGGGQCMDCHKAVKGARRQIVADDAGNGGDFKGRSHHVAGTNWNVQVVENFDCLVCHGEGKVLASDTTKTTTTDVHNNTSSTVNPNRQVMLLNVDSAKAWRGAGVDPVDSTSVLGTDYYAWDPNATGATRDAMLLNLDRFCLACHDADGAVVAYNMNPVQTWRPATNKGLQPFGKADILRSPTDGAQRPPTNVVFGDGVTRGTVVNVYTQSNPAGSSPGCSKTASCGVWTKFSFHALKVFGKSRYTTTTPPTGVSITSGGCRTVSGCTNPFTTGAYCAGAACNDTSMMYCSDCHRADLNAHGSNIAEQMLKCAPGGTGCTTGKEDILGQYKAQNNVCVRCHTVTVYGPSHTAGNTGDFAEVACTNSICPSTPATRYDTAYVPGSKSANNYNLFQMACINCHGGTDYGAIHGTGETITPIANSATVAKRAWRFMNGASHSETQPLNGMTASDTGNPTQDSARWSGTHSFQCFTLGTSPDRSPRYGSCTAHGGGGSQAVQAGLNRPLDY